MGEWFVAAGFPADDVTTSVWFWLTSLIGVIWLRRHGDLRRGRTDPVLRAEEPGAPFDELPSLSVLVAAKDEEANIERCLAGLLAQEYPRLQVVAIDDRSTDRTPQILDDLAQRDARLAVVHVRQLPEGWFGKNNAMHQGVTSHARGEWLCFTDADCAYDSPHLLAAAVRFALRERVDFLSVLPRLEANSFWERVVQPVAGAIMVYWFPPQKVNSRGSAVAYANGAFMLTPRSVYDRIGGHEPVRATLNEDMHLARRVKQYGLRLHVIRGGDLYRVRMYSGIEQIWRGWSRIFYGCLGTAGRLSASVLMLTFLSLSPWVSLALSPLAGSDAWWIAGSATFAVFSQQSILWGFYGLTGSSPAMALTYPLGALVCLMATLNAMRRLGGSATSWRGTVYRGGAHAPGVSP